MDRPAPLLFLGSKPLGLSLLEELAVLAGDRLAAAATCDDSADGRSCLPAFRAFARTRGLPLEAVPPQELGAWVERWRPYAVIVCGWYWKIPLKVLTLAPGGFLGLHASLLPRYRGSAPLVWALLNGEPEAGVSLFRMEEGMDTGDLLAQERFPLGPDDTIADALAKAETASLAALRQAVPGLLAGRPAFRPQSAEGASVFPRRAPADGRLDWGASAGAIHNAIRAQTRPYPGAFAFLGDQKVSVWSAARPDGPPVPGAVPAEPGRVLLAGPEGARVACGRGDIVLREIQFEGEAPSPAGARLRAGDRLS